MNITAYEQLIAKVASNENLNIIQISCSFISMVAILLKVVDFPALCNSVRVRRQIQKEQRKSAKKIAEMERMKELFKQLMNPGENTGESAIDVEDEEESLEAPPVRIARRKQRVVVESRAESKV